MIKLLDLINECRIRKKNIYFRYSTEEQFTGEYWLDDKKIYQRTWVVGARGGNVTTSLALNNIDQIWVDMANSFYIEAGSDGGGNRWPINGNLGDGQHSEYITSGRGPYYVSGEKKLYWSVPWSGCTSAYITIRYTKTTN